jgi:hypothetical protein
MRRYAIFFLISLALSIGAAGAQSGEYYGGSLSLHALVLPLPLIGAHVGFDDLIAEDVSLRLHASGFAFGASGDFLFAGVAGADVLWDFPVGDGAALLPYAGGGPGVVFAGLSGAGVDVAPYAGVVAGVSYALDGFRIFVEGRGNVAFGFLDDVPWWMSIAVGVDFTP